MYGRLDSSNQICNIEDSTSSNYGRGPKSACGADYWGDSVQLRILKQINNKISSSDKWDGWQIRKCMNTNSDAELSGLIASRPRAALYSPNGVDFAYQGKGKAILDTMWERVRNKYGTMGLPYNLEDHKDPVTGLKMKIIPAPQPAV